MNWHFAEIVSLNNNEIFFKTINNKKSIEGNLFYKNLKWTIPKKKTIRDVYEIGDIIFVKKQNNLWKIKQYPKVNGGIVILDPYTGDVKALVGGFNFKTSEFNRVTQAKRQPGSVKPIVYAAALEKGFAPNTIILDAPFVESQGVGLKIGSQKIMEKNFTVPQHSEKELNIQEI